MLETEGQMEKPGLSCESGSLPVGIPARWEEEIGPQDTSLCWQEATRCLSKSKELMETVLRDPGLLALQREGGTTLASLQQEASGLNVNPDVRYRYPVSPPSFPVRAQK